ncbi:hypothetical protein [Limnohabitans sp.]|uniref:hypothetical protein n=1 Tax=Limnohabitans sp. TaxID=1907725 RepID=UPI00286EBE5D|nr:hypothetical protein [Limnohabitans sp.]
MPIYKIIQGSFVDHDGQVKGEGETIELSEEFAANRNHDVVLAESLNAPESESTGDNASA